MQRTQIYLTRDQKLRLEAIARSKSVSMADVVREAVSRYLAGTDSQYVVAQLQATFGGVAEWQDRDGIELARELREKWERTPSPDQEVPSERGSRR